MIKARRMALICLALLTFDPVDSRMQGNGESSGEYLQKAMHQLQEFNVPLSDNVQDRLSWSDGYNNMLKEKQNYPVQRINMIQRQKYRNQSNNDPVIEKSDVHRYDAESLPYYYQPYVSPVSKIQEPEALGFTRTQLASMYKDALEKGSSVSLSSLTKALTTGGFPQVTQTHVEYPVKPAHYQYYFFPLKTFMSELRNDHGYKTIPVVAFENTAAAVSAPTSLTSHPLFVAISTVMTMAIVFMMSVFVLPRFPLLNTLLQSREIQDDFLQLSDVVVNAINRYNLLENFKGQRVVSMR
ncbi:PREDICTED: uncharacterized protein LOC107185274 [Dufourea novaeangliae]|uniref:Uncharacterized protein n=1 Tax=Dufourea novaeangliae TaxID=178035 RepID=A0A154P4Z6_DUFNO|nr:PREDICTED: uncharacterized protein LOC107185274 [Dufourea novaeangliae]KZC06999.1 hypothetical protein WN55_08883 [Dufourea novaeangliae]